MSSSRLPGKVLIDLAGKPVLWHIVNRLKKSEFIEKIVVATSNDDSDKAIVSWCQSNLVDFFVGELEDVLDRYYKTSVKFDADPIVRITGDCPLVDPEIVDEVILNFLKGGYDAYSLGGEFPDGLDCQIFSFNAIEIAWERATLKSEREHVGPFIEKNKEKIFKVSHLKKFNGLGHHRWTLDEEKDLIFLTEIFSKLSKNGDFFNTNDVLDFLNKNKHLMDINSKIVRNEGYLKSLEMD